MDSSLRDALPVMYTTDLMSGGLRLLHKLSYGFCLPDGKCQKMRPSKYLLSTMTTACA